MPGCSHHILNGRRCLEKNLSGMPCENWTVAKQTKPVVEFRNLLLDYNAAEDIYLAPDDYLGRWNNRKVHGEDRFLDPGESIPFGDEDPGSTERGHDPAVRCEEWVDSVCTCQDNILLSAPAGFGKTHVIQNALIPALQRVHGKSGVWVTASTGIAALALEGVTIHSAAGVRRANLKAKDLVREMKAAVRTRWQKVKVIIIEEFSMLSASFLDLLHEVACLMKRSRAAFGGVQIVLVGESCTAGPCG